MLTILIILFILFIAGKVITLFFNDLGSFWKPLAKWSGIIFFIILIFSLSIYFSYLSKSSEYLDFESSIEKIETRNIIIIDKIINMNTSLSIAKYWNNTLFDIFIPDNYAELKFIQLKEDKNYVICFEKLYNFEIGYADKNMIENFLNKNNIKEKDIIKAEYNTNGIFWILYKKY